MTPLKTEPQKRSSSKVTSLLMATLVLLAAQCKPVNNVANKSAVGKSNFIFYGTVVKMNSSNIDVPTPSETAVVMVDEVLDAVPPYDKMNGKEVTVLLSQNQQRAAGQKGLFYTIGWYYGKTLGVKEVSEIILAETKKVAKEDITMARKNLNDDSLRVQLRRAELVIQGVVAEVKSGNAPKTRFESEHNPELQIASIKVESVLKGETRQKLVEVSFAASQDVMWNNSPKLAKNQKAIFLLQINQAPKILDVTGYTVLDGRDVQPYENLKTIKYLLKEKKF